MLKNSFKRHFCLLFIEEKGKRHYFIIKDFSILIHDHTLQCGRKYFCRYYLQAFSSKEILNYYINGCFKMVGKRCLKYLKNVNILHSKIIRGKSYLR